MGGQGGGQEGVGTEQGSHAKKWGWMFLSINDLTQLLQESPCMLNKFTGISDS